jgi:2-C-methyl-D-erythritol 2,4-cyclodiphosphate synthase
MNIRVGTGFDAHAYGPGDSVALGGLRIAHTRGVVAHSDGDVLLHALCDALLGAMGLGDIGQHFPDSDPQWKGVHSDRFVTAVMQMLKQRGYAVGNADITLLAQLPRIAAHRDAIRLRIAQLLEVDASQVCIKATTTEYLGFIGRSEGLAALATVLITRPA